jgi:hypothetical protein
MPLLREGLWALHRRAFETLKLILVVAPYIAEAFSSLAFFKNCLGSLQILQCRQ